MLGDNAYFSGTDDEYQAAVFSVFQPLLRTIPLWPTIGNHETYAAAADGHIAYYDIFSLPLALDRLGSMVIDIDGDRLEAKFLRETGEVDDHFTILKGTLPPQIVSGPASQTVVEGATVSFSVVASGSRPLAYQWFFNAMPLPDATNATLTLNNVQASQAGAYAVRVTNAIGAVLSSNAALTVQQVTSCAPPGLAAWWRWEGNGEDVFLRNPAQLLGNPVFVNGEVGQALALNGANQAAKVPASATLDLGAGSGLSIECWINPANVAAIGILVEWNDGRGRIGVHLDLAVPIVGGGGPGALYANLVDAAGQSHQVASAARLVLAGEWQHVALTYDKGSGLAALYLDGMRVAETNLGSFWPQTSYDLYVGERPSGPVSGTW
jgi:hypothetical protein